VRDASLYLLERLALWHLLGQRLVTRWPATEQRLDQARPLPSENPTCAVEVRTRLARHLLLSARAARKGRPSPILALCSPHTNPRLGRKSQLFRPLTNLSSLRRILGKRHFAIRRYIQLHRKR